MKEIERLFLNNGLILFGELHGTKETPLFLLNLLKKLKREHNFVVCLEIPSEFQEDIKRYFLEEKMKGGFATKEYFFLIEELKKIGIKVYFIDSYSQNQQQKEDNLAININKFINNSIKTVAILGDFHTYKNIVTLPDVKILPTGYLLSKKTEKMTNIRIAAKRGKFFNNGIKDVNFDELDPINEGFDYVYIMKKVSPCTFLEE